MCLFAVIFFLAVASAGRAADLDKVPANTWVELKFTTEQPGDHPEEKGQWRPVGWNKLVYDPDGKRVLFYDRWVDKKHGGLTIYGNCLFALDPIAGKIRPIKIDNWNVKRLDKGGYRTMALPENDQEPTPCPRHVYQAFEYVPDLKAVFISNGANQTRHGAATGNSSAMTCVLTPGGSICRRNNGRGSKGPPCRPIGSTMRWRIAPI